MNVPGRPQCKACQNAYKLAGDFVSCEAVALSRQADRKSEMARVEQAVFTSARTDLGVGYQIVASSPGIGKADQRTLAIWGPSHDSLSEIGDDAVSFNFFPLPSGAFCISRTAPVGWEYSGRGGTRIYTHCLVVPPAILLQFANHPLALAWAAAAIGVFDIHAEAPFALESLDITGTVPAVHQALLAQLVRQVGAWHLAMLVQSVLTATYTVVATGCASAEQLIAGLLDCLPLERRTAISFSTGLRYSSQRPFRILPLPSDPTTRRRLVHQPNVMVLDLVAQKPCSHMLVDNWARLIERVLSKNQIGLLADELSQPRPDLTLSNLPVLGLKLLEDLETTSLFGTFCGDCSVP